MSDADVIDMIKRILADSGYMIAPPSSYNFDFKASRGREEMDVKYKLVSSQSDMRELVNVARGVGGSALIVSPGYFTESMRRLAETNGIVLWDRNDFEGHIGKVALIDLENGRNEAVKYAHMGSKSAGFTGSERSYDSRNYVPHDPAGRGDGENESFLAGFFGGVTSEDARSSVTSSSYGIDDRRPGARLDSYARLDGGTPVKTTELKIRSLPITISAEDAIAVARGKVRDPQISKLKFIPVLKYDYRFDLGYNYRERIIPISGEGSIAISAITGEILDIYLDRIVDSVVVPLEEEYSIEKAVRSKDSIHSIAVEELIEVHTKEVTFNEVDSSVIMTENKRFGPREKDLNLSAGEVLYVPIWDINCSEGFIEIDATTGNELNTPIDSGAEFI